MITDAPPPKLIMPERPALVRASPFVAKAPYVWRPSLRDMMLLGVLPGMTGAVGFGDEYPPAATVVAVNFDGTNDYLSRGAGLTSANDSKLLTFSFWIRKQGADSVGELIIKGGAGGTSINKNGGGNNIGVFGRNSADATILSIATASSSVLVASGWRHCCGSVNMANSSERHLYLNDVSDLNVTTYTDDTIDFTQTNWTIGALNDGTAKLNADIAELWFAPGVYIDLSVESNRRKFVTSSIKPVGLGVDGSLVTGTAPLVFQSGDTASWETNKGTGGGFTENGALTTAATSPSD